MNGIHKNIRKSLILLLGGFIILSLYYCYTLFSYGDRWFANSYNPRVRMNGWEPKVIPGDIMDRNGRILATTLKEIRKNPETGEKQEYYYRSYLGGKEKAKAISHVVGFNHPEFGRSGSEALHVRYLMGHNNPFYEVIYQKVFLSKEMGNTLFLTIDNELQQYIDSVLGNKKGSAVVMDAKTGEMLAMVSHPTFNPNNLEADIDGDVLVNRSTEGLYAPGSIFKVILASSVLDNTDLFLDNTFNCEGETMIGSEKIGCFNGQEHGEVDLKQAMIVSCNGSFAHMGVELGRERLLKTGKAFGFNEDFIFPDLKLAASRMPLKAGIPKEKLGFTSIGQGDIQVTPMHMAMVASSIANDGVMMEPKLILKVLSRNSNEQKTLKPKRYKRTIEPENVVKLKDMLEAVVTEGTGKAATIKGKIVAGKTGTAEVMTEDSEIRNNAWFIGYVESKTSNIAISIVLEDLPPGETGGKTAAPMAGQILKKAIDLGY
ncbi:MAG TPA: penicillin-binding protein 2 [Clostridia bacterium]|nr:penicillin-binding protein 2 [Clostridia bacterium]